MKTTRSQNSLDGLPYHFYPGSTHRYKLSFSNEHFDLIKQYWVMEFNPLKLLSLGIKKKKKNRRIRLNNTPVIKPLLVYGWCLQKPI